MAVQDRARPGVGGGQQLMSGSSPVVIAYDQDSMNDREMRNLQELQTVFMADAEGMSHVRRFTERYTLADRRGAVGRGSTR